jgi:hypothetical protein
MMIELFHEALPLKIEKLHVAIWKGQLRSFHFGAGLMRDHLGSLKTSVPRN